MTRRQLLRTAGLAGLGTLGPPLLNLGRCRLDAAPAVEISTRAADLVLGTTVIDMLGLLTLDWAQLFRWHRNPGEFRERDYRRLELAGVNVFHPAVETAYADAYAGAVRWIAGWRHMLRSFGCFLGAVGTVADLEVVPTQGKLGVVVGFQDSDHFRTTADVERFYRAGQRVSQLTYNTENALGSGCYVPDRGLTPYGAEVVAEMNRLGMAVDVSHCGERTSLDAIAASRVPVLVTHANCKALLPAQPRCKSDEVIRRLAAAGGVMGITVVRAFVARSRPTLDDLLDHFDHVARVAGPEHVGLGSDVDPTAIDPRTGAPHPFYSIAGLDPLARVFQIADGLLARGWSAADVRLVLGGNFRRALDAIWRPGQEPTARELRRDPFCPAPHPRAPGS